MIDQIKKLQNVLINNKENLKNFGKTEIIIKEVSSMLTKTLLLLKHSNELHKLLQKHSKYIAKSERPASAEDKRFCMKYLELIEEFSKLL